MLRDGRKHAESTAFRRQQNITLNKTYCLNKWVFELANKISSPLVTALIIK